MSRIRLMTALSLVMLTLLAVTGCTSPCGETLDRLAIGEVMMHAEFSENLRALSVPGGRLSGTPGAAEGEEYVARKLREYGLHNVHFEPFEMQSWIVRDTKVTLLTDPPRVLDGAVALGRTQTTPSGGVTAPVIDLGVVRKEEDITSRAGDVAGKFVLVRDSGLRRGHKLRLALESGAAGLIVMSRPERLPIIGNAHKEPRPEPAVAILHDQSLLDLLAPGTDIRANIQLQTEFWDCQPRNIVGEIPGRGPLADEVVILCAHLDSWHLGEGAIDNGTGSAAILETARALAAIDWQPRRTVRFVWFMAEELGLRGSTAYVEQHRDELDNIVAVVNVDMPGMPKKFGTLGPPTLTPVLRSLLPDLAGYEISEEIGEWSGAWSDHAPFNDEGIPAIALSGDMGPGVKYYHTTGDVYDEVDRARTVPASAVFAVLLRRLADEPLPSTPVQDSPDAE